MTKRNLRLSMCNKIITIKGVKLTKVLVHDLSNTKLLATKAFLGYDSYGGLSAKGECAGAVPRQLEAIAPGKNIRVTRPAVRHCQDVMQILQSTGHLLQRFGY